MGESLERIRLFISQFFSRLNFAQKVVVAGIAVVLLALIILALVVTSAQPYEPLFAELSPKDAGEIVERLRERGVDYRLENGGKTVMVPSGQVYELRVEFARAGLPETGTVGYELFDRQELGVTEFQQQVAYKRALEGELARTIRSIEGVENAAVMIVIPRDRLFEKDQQKPTASVQLKLRRKAMPSPATIEAIAHLVANSVEGLQPENVTITDTRGRILSDNRDQRGLMSMSSDQLDFTRRVEKDLEEKALAVLEKRVGPGNVTVKVNASLNWAQVEKTIQDVDPDRTVTISEEITEGSTPGGENGAANATSSNIITNYETRKTLQRVVEEVGNIERLSVAVMVNHKQETVTDGEGKPQVKIVPRDVREMAQLELLAKTAVGFNEKRNDQFSIVNMEFEAPGLEDPEGGFSWMDNLYDILEKGLIVIVLILGILVVRSILNSAKEKSEEIELQMRKMVEEKTRARAALSHESATLNALTGESEAVSESDDEVVMSDEFFRLAKKRNQKHEHVKAYIEQNPDAATKLIKVWLMDEEEA